MSFKFNRLGRIVFLLASVTFVLSFAGLFYYLNIKDNERYQNQLHFRELSQIQGGLEIGLEGFAKIGEKFQRTADKLAIGYSQSKITEAELANFEEAFQKLREIANKRDENYNRYNGERKDWKTSLEEDNHQNNLVQNKSDKLERLKSAYEIERVSLLAAERNKEHAKTKVLALIGKFPEAETMVEEQYLSEIINQCDHNQTFCEDIDNLYASIFEFDFDTKQETTDLATEFKNNHHNIICEPDKKTCKYNVLINRIENREKAISRIKALFDKTASINDVQAINEKELLCKDPLIWANDFNCQDTLAYLNKKLSNNAHQASDSDSEVDAKAQSTVTESNKGSANAKRSEPQNHFERLQSRITRLIRIEKNKLALTNNFMRKVKSMGLLSKVPNALTDYSQTLATYNTRLKAFNDAQETYNLNDQKVLGLEYNNSNERQFARYDAARRTYIQSFEEHKNASQRLAKLVKDIIDRIKANLPRTLQTNTLTPVIPAEIDFLGCLQTTLENKLDQIDRCSKNLQETRDELGFEGQLESIIIENQKLTRTAFPSIQYESTKKGHTNCSAATFSSGVAGQDINLRSPLQTKQRGVWELSIPLKKGGVDSQLTGLSCAKKEAFYYGRFKILLNDLLPDKTEFFPLILMVDGSGKLMFRQENVLTGAFQSGLYFEMTDDILKALSKKQTFKSTTTNKDNNKTDGDFPGYSGQIEILIAGEAYSVFISPWNGFGEVSEDKDTATKTPVFYLIGITPKSKLTANKLAIPNSTLVAIIFLLLALVALIPLVKIRLVSYRQAFTRTDRQHVAIGLSLLVILLISGMLHTVVYQHWKKETKNQNIGAFVNIKDSFNNEVKQIDELADHELISLKKGLTINEGLFPKPHLFNLYNDSIITGPNKYDRVFLENAFLLKDDGLLQVDHQNLNLTDENSVDSKKIYAKWSNEALAARSNLPLKLREYFTIAKACNGWLLTSNDRKCSNTMYLQRIMSKVDGRKTIQFSVPLFDKISQIPDMQHVVYSFGTRLKTFLKPLLPLDSGFAVIENKTGKVLFHSDDERSLIENMFVETDNNTELRSVVQNPFNNDYVEFVSTYRGKAHIFVTGRLSNRIPWTLIVYHDKETMRDLSMLMGFSAVIILFLLLLFCQIIYLLLQGLGKGHFVRNYTWFNTKLVKHDAYKPLTIAIIAVSLIGLCLASFVRWSSENELTIGWLALLILGYWSVLWLVLCKTSEYVCEGLKEKTEDSEQSENLSRSPRREYLLPNKKDIDNYSIYLIVLLFAFWSVPSFLITTESASFYLQKYASMERQNVEKNRALAEQIQSDYFDLVVAKPEPDLRALEKLKEYELFKKAFSKVKNFSGLPLVGDTSNKQQYWIHSNNSSKKSTYGLYSAIWRQINLGFELASKISIHVKVESKRLPLGSSIASNSDDFNYLTPIIFMRILGDAIAHFWVIALLFLVFGVFLFWWLITRWVCRRLMGLYIPQNLRLNDSLFKDRNRLSLLKRMAITDTQNHKGQCAQLIRSTGRTRRMFDKRQTMDDPRLRALIDSLFLRTNAPVTFYDLQFKDDTELKSVFKHKLNIDYDKDTIGGTIVLTGLEMVAMDVNSRSNALRILSILISKKHLNIILLADISPLYRLTQQLAYPGASKTEQTPMSEVIQWSRILKRFVKFYDWTPRSRGNLNASASSYETLLYEAQSWPELKTIHLEFLQYHSNVKDTELEYRDKQLMKDSKPLNEDALAKSINEHWLPEQVVEFFNANAGATYCYRWELCTQEERLLLIQLANGDSPNPMHLEPIEHMVRRGYLFRCNGWHIVNKSFNRYLLTAESEETVARWMNNASESSWKYIRVPLLVLMIVVLGLLAYTANDAFESLAAILTASLGILPLILRSIGLVKGETGSVPED